MRYREPFTIFPRRFKSGKIIYYYRTYDKYGNRTSGKSTGQSTKTLAKAYCYKLMKVGSLIASKPMTFAEYAKDWWIYDKCAYVQGKLKRGYKISRTYVDFERANLENHLLPYFGKKKLAQITPAQI